MTTDKQTRVAVLLGSTRTGSLNRRIAEHLADAGRLDGASVRADAVAQAADPKRGEADELCRPIVKVVAAGLAASRRARTSAGRYGLFTEMTRLPWSRRCTNGESLLDRP